jgi:tetratricopeptide (TPR) repeat protein
VNLKTIKQFSLLFSDAKELYESGMEELFHGNPEEAEKYFACALDLDPDNALCWTSRAECYKQMNLHIPSLIASQKSIELDRQVNADTYVRILQIHTIFGDLNGGKEIIEKFNQLSWSDQEKGTMNEAIQQFDRLKSFEEGVNVAMEQNNFQVALERAEVAHNIANECVRYENFESSCLVELVCSMNENA